MEKRLISLVTALALVLSLCPSWALAAEITRAPDVASSEVRDLNPPYTRISNVYGELRDNQGHIDEIRPGGKVQLNNMRNSGEAGNCLINANSGCAGTNKGQINTNTSTGDIQSSSGEVPANLGTTVNNSGTLGDNQGTINNSPETTWWHLPATGTNADQAEFSNRTTEKSALGQFDYIQDGCLITAKDGYASASTASNADIAEDGDGYRITNITAAP